MAVKKTFDHQVVMLPPLGVPDDHYFVKGLSDTYVKHYICNADFSFSLVGQAPSVIVGNTQTYVYQQDVPTDIWIIVHNLGYYPSISVVDSSSRKVYGDEEYININTVKVSFDGAFAGKAYLS